MVGFLENTVLPLKRQLVVLLPMVIVEAEAAAPFPPMTMPPDREAPLPIKILPDVWVDAKAKLSVIATVPILFVNSPPANV